MPNSLDRFLSLGQVKFDCPVVSVQVQVPDHSMQVTVQESCGSGRVCLNVGDTLVSVKVLSPDGTNSQVSQNPTGITINRGRLTVFCHHCYPTGKGLVIWEMWIGLHTVEGE